MRMAYSPTYGSRWAPARPSTYHLREHAAARSSEVALTPARDTPSLLSKHQSARSRSVGCAFGHGRRAPRPHPTFSSPSLIRIPSRALPVHHARGCAHSPPLSKRTSPDRILAMPYLHGPRTTLAPQVHSPTLVGPCQCAPAYARRSLPERQRGAHLYTRLVPRPPMQITRAALAAALAQHSMAAATATRPAELREGVHGGSPAPQSHQLRGPSRVSSPITTLWHATARWGGGRSLPL